MRKKLTKKQMVDLFWYSEKWWDSWEIKRYFPELLAENMIEVIAKGEVYEVKDGSIYHEGKEIGEVPFVEEWVIKAKKYDWES